MKAVVVVVLYGKTVEESECVRSLKRYFIDNDDIKILLISNSQGETIATADWYEAYQSTENLGLTAPYQFGLNYANANGAKYLITFDQDTEINENYVEAVYQLLKKNIESTEEKVSAYLPILYDVEEDRPCSPGVIDPRERLSTRRYDKGSLSSYDVIVGFNSGAIYRVEALNAIGGFPLDYPLDFSDGEIFRKLHYAGYYPHVMDNIRINHSLSINSNDGMSRMRFVSFLHYAKKFYFENASYLAKNADEKALLQNKYENLYYEYVKKIKRKAFRRLLTFKKGEPTYSTIRKIERGELVLSDEMINLGSNFESKIIRIG